MVNYKIYPSLLDRFQRLLNTEEDFESMFNEDTENGGYKVSYDEMYARNERELIDAINRVPHEPIELADRGTAFNEIVDALIEHRASSREDITFKSYKMGETPYQPHIEASINGWTFRFDLYFCLGVARYFEGSTPQHLCEATIGTAYGDVLLYGYADEIRQDVVYDIKTCKQYQFGKYEHHWQRYIYPYCLVESKEMTEVREFEYTPIVLTGGTSRTPLITGTLYRERYDYNHTLATIAIRNICERFIEWLEAHKEQITDKKIFGGINESNK